MCWRMLAVLVLARITLGLAFQVAVSTAPFLTDAFGIGLTDIGLFVGLFMLPGMVLALPAGMLGVWTGDKWMVVAGFGLMAAGLLLSGTASHWWAVLLGRTLTGVGAVPLLVLMTKMVFDWFVGSRAFFMAMSLHFAGWPVGHAIGQPALTALAQAEGWPAAHLAAAAFCVFTLCVMALVYAPPPAAAPLRQAPLSALTRREVTLITLAGMLWMTVNGTYIVALGFGQTLLVERGYTPLAAASLASLLPLAMMTAIPLGGWFTMRLGRPDTVIVGSILVSVGFAGWLTLDANAFAFVGFGFAGAFGVSAISTLPAEALREQVRSAGLGYYFVWFFFGTAGLPALAGWVGDATATAAAPMAVATAGQLVCLLPLFAFRFTQRRWAVTDKAR